MVYYGLHVHIVNIYEVQVKAKNLDYFKMAERDDPIVSSRCQLSKSFSKSFSITLENLNSY